jgi:diguanylate cyclase (GGDEF)-like protein/PAS domain S-box-containing protein
MLIAPPTSNEEERIALLHALELLDSPPEAVFDRITRLAAQVMKVPIAVVSLIDRDRQWFKSRVGLDVNETPRDYAFCAHAIHHPEPLVVPDALQDSRFEDNPLVHGSPHIRFYAGTPLFSSNGVALGTLCIIDRAPRVPTDEEMHALADLAALAQREILQREATHLSQSISDRSSQAVADSDARFQATFEQAAVGIAIVGLDGRWTRVNHRLCEFLDYEESELLRLTFQDVTYPDDLNTDLALVQQTTAGLIDQYSLAKRYIRRDGTVVWADLSVSLQRDRLGVPQYFISVVADIQARKEAEASLQALRRELEDRVQQRTQQLQQINQMLQLSIEQQRQSENSLANNEALLRAVLENAQDAYICIDAASVIMEWNRQAELTFGWTSEEAIGQRLDEMIVPVQYRAAHKKGIERYLATGDNAVLNKRVELVAMRRDGSLFPVEIRISPLPSEHGHLFCAFLHDISERKRIAEALQESKNQLHTITDNLPVQIAYIDAEQRFRFANEAYRSVFDLPPEKIIGRTLGETLGAEIYARIAGHVQRVLSGQREIFEITMTGDDESFWSVTYIPDVRERAVAGFYVMAQDITARKELELSLERQATQDPLTGLPNRRALLAGLTRALERADRAGLEIGVLFFDLDGFKGINDRYGHDAGDYVLKQFAERLLACVRATDIVSRLAGDEFVVVLEGLRDGAAESGKVAAQILDSMQAPIEFSGQRLALGTSIGLSIYRAGDTSGAERLLSAADQAMYEAKRGGKNRLSLAAVSEPPSAYSSQTQRIGSPKSS